MSKIEYVNSLNLVWKRVRNLLSAPHIPTKMIMTEEYFPPEEEEMIE